MSVEGVGLGLRFPLLAELLARPRAELPEIQWLECHPENYITSATGPAARRGGRFSAGLQKCREKWDFATHGLTMSLGSVEPLDVDYLKSLKHFLRELAVPWHSDHLCFSMARGHATHDLLPLPLNEAVAKHVAARVRQAQDVIETTLAIENISYYALPRGSDLSEGEFVSAVCELADCKLMLDVNNVYVNATNHGGDAHTIINQMPLHRVVQMHVAGHYRESRDLIIDTHSEPMVEPVFDLLTWTLSKTGKVPVLLERDNEIPAFDVLLDEIRRLDAIYQAAPTRGSNGLAHV